MAKSFKTILPCENFTYQVVGLTFVLKLFHALGGVLKLLRLEINGHDREETYLLLLICISAVMFLVLAILKSFTLRPAVLGKHPLQREKELKMPESYLQEMDFPINRTLYESKFWVICVNNCCFMNN